MAELETEVELIKKELHDRKKIHDRLDVAIENELHSRITTNTKEIMKAAASQHMQQNKEIQKIKDELISRVGVLEKWRHVLIGGSIVVGFMLHKFMDFT